MSVPGNRPESLQENRGERPPQSLAEDPLLALRGAVEHASGRLREAGALLEALDAADCLESGSPGRPDPGRQRAVSLLAVLRRELTCVCELLDRAVLSTPGSGTFRS